MYQALYRKWRPKTFDDVVGQEHITTTLKNQVKSGKPSHAYLFCGSRGTGKTSCSKILAKAVNCPDQAGGNPCGECDVCKGIESDSILDVTEIDAASNSGVDNIRDLREEANFTPVTTKYRVYIIDETHMLSPGAFNALLKIMEEPPPHVLFVLATTELHKVPATILSRCQRFDFHRISGEIIAKRLLYIAERERANLHEDAALLIARLSDGGMRDALSLLDLCLSGSGEITLETVHERAGLAGQDYLFDIADAVIQGDGASAMKSLASLWRLSIDYQRFCEQLAGFYRNLMIVKTTKDPTELVTCLPQELERLKDTAGSYSLERIFYCLNTLADTGSRIAKTAMRRTELEMGILRLTNPAMDVSPEALLTRIEKLERERGEMPATPAFSEAKTGRISCESEPPAVTVAPKTPVEPFEPWPEVVEVLQNTNKALHGALIGSKAYTSDNLLLIDGGELFAQMVRSDSYARKSVREAMLSITGKKYSLGPYQAEKHEVKKPGAEVLDQLLNSAQQLGIEIQVKE